MNDGSTFLAIMAMVIVIACVAVLMYLPADAEMEPLTVAEKQAVVNRW